LKKVINGLKDELSERSKEEYEQKFERRRADEEEIKRCKGVIDEQQK